MATCHSDISVVVAKRDVVRLENERTVGRAGIDAIQVARKGHGLEGRIKVGGGIINACIAVVGDGTPIACRHGVVDINAAFGIVVHFNIHEGRVCVLQPDTMAVGMVERAVGDGRGVGIIKVEVGVVFIALAAIFDVGIAHHRRHAAITGILEMHAFPIVTSAAVGGQQDGIGLGTVEEYGSLPNNQTRVGHELDDHARLNLVHTRGEADVFGNEIRATRQSNGETVVEVASQLGKPCKCERHVSKREVVGAVGCEAEHILDIAVALVDDDGKVGTSRNPATKHSVGSGHAVKDLVGCGRRDVSETVTQLLQILRSANIKRKAHKSGFCNYLGTRVHRHITNSIIQCIRNGLSTAKEYFVAKGKSGALGVTFGQ